ncbi:UNVERIFIED_ORG: arylesterase [Shinella sp. XGS7]|nr:arylesterase [Shinella sp. XGS7]
MNRRRWMRDCSLLALGPWVSGLAAAQAQTQTAKPRRVLVVGDSLSAEYGIARGSGWVALLQQRLQGHKPAYEVINASISGDTTAGGRARLAALLSQHNPSHVLIELGGNDALRGLPLASTRENLLSMVRAAKAAGARVQLVGMQVPPNYGSAYARDFAGLFAEVARAEKTALTPFLLQGVADRPDAMDWFQPDRIHPLAKAHPLMLEQVWQGLKPLL